MNEWDPDQTNNLNYFSFKAHDTYGVLHSELLFGKDLKNDKKKKFKGNKEEKKVSQVMTCEALVEQTKTFAVYVSMCL